MDITQLTQAINSVATPGRLDGISEQQRVELFQACNKLKESIVSPLDKTVEILFSVRAWLLIVVYS